MWGVPKRTSATFALSHFWAMVQVSSGLDISPKNTARTSSRVQSSPQIGSQNVQAIGFARWRSQWLHWRTCACELFSELESGDEEINKDALYELAYFAHKPWRIG